MLIRNKSNLNFFVLVNLDSFTMMSNYFCPKRYVDDFEVLVKNVETIALSYTVNSYCFRANVCSNDLRFIYRFKL